MLLESRANFPAIRDLFSFVFAGTDLCHGVKLTVLSMHGSYLATESSRDTSCCVGSLNNSGNTVKECAGHSGLKSQSANIWGKRFRECHPRLWTAVQSKRVSTHGRGLFPVLVNPANAKEKRRLLVWKGLMSLIST